GINGCSQLSPLGINGCSQFSPLSANSRSQFSPLGINSVIKVEEAHGSQTDESNDETDGGNDEADQNPVFHGRRGWPSRGNGLLGEVRGTFGGGHGPVQCVVRQYCLPSGISLLKPLNTAFEGIN
ncbi:MAG: hypothetical protein TQ37_07805, partial [Candidatus Synechococcus spongiarum 15L]